MGSFEEKLSKKIQFSVMHVCKYVNQRVTRIGEQNGKSFKGVSTTKEKKKQEIEVYNSIQD